MFAFKSPDSRSSGLDKHSQYGLKIVLLAWLVSLDKREVEFT